MFACNPYELARNNILKGQSKSDTKPNRVGVCVYMRDHKSIAWGFS